LFPTKKVFLIFCFLSDSVADIVISSLKTCNMNCGSHWEGKGRVGSKGWAVDHQPGTSEDGHSHHDHQKWDLQVSKKGWFICARGLIAGKRGKQVGGGGGQQSDIHESAVRICITAQVCSHLMNIVFRL
jgi:hypothetical protein